MIAYLNGLIDEKHPTRVVIDVAGVGYELFIPLSSYDRLPLKGEICRILTFDYVKEDTHSLFGFMTSDERDMFVMLMSISGIGPKLALSALSGMSVRDLRASVVEGDVKRLSGISGIGKKMAERMVLELRDKISDADGFDAIAGADELGAADSKSRDAMMALIALGYKQEAARKMISSVTKINPDANVEELIKKSLGG